MAAKINYVGDFTRVTEEEKGFINKRLQRFEEKFEGMFSEMLIKIDSHIHKETSRGRQAYFVKLHVFTDKGKFNAEDQEFSAEKAIGLSLDKIEKQIEKEISAKKTTGFLKK
jgi:ribosomal subunit interface protein